VNNRMSYTLDDRQVRLILPHRVPMLLVDRVSECAVSLDSMQAIKQITVGDSMMFRSRHGHDIFPPTLLVEALAQSCGLLMKLRWVEAQGVSVADFASGDDSVLNGIRIPYSVLAETRARQFRLACPGNTLRLNIHLKLERQSLARFSASASSEVGLHTELDVLLAFPEYTAWLNQRDR
jgi:3-hydroxymyristoyl/3-hydroxydecanoyl-(acyl carrier protein) dehydratase